MRQKST